MKKAISRCKTTIAVCALLSAFFFSGIALAGDFSADFLSKSADPSDMPGKGKMYMKNGMMRYDIEENVVIMRPDKGVMWILMNEEKMYMEQPVQGQGRMQQWKPERVHAARNLGKENVSGYACTKYEISSQGNPLRYWVSDKIPFPVKMEDGNGYMLLKNIQEGNVSQALFEIPKGYQKMVIPTMPGMPQGMPGMPQMPGGMKPPGK